MPLISNLKKLSKSKVEATEDAQYYLSTKVQSEYFFGRFSRQITAWNSDPIAIEKAKTFKQYFGKKTIPLKPNLRIFKKINWEGVVLNRISKRNFNGKSIPFTAISNLLLMSCGLKENGKWLRKPKVARAWPRRALPSAGATYPLEYYILALNISGLPRGLYHFNSFSSELTLIKKKKAVLNISEICSQDSLYNKPAAIIYTTAIFEKSRAKYGPRSLRFIMLEAGGVNAHFSLLASAMKLDCCMDGGGYEDRIEQLLGIQPRQEGLVSTFFIGRT